MTSAAVISLVCGVGWAVLFYYAIRHRDMWSVLVVLLAWAVNLFLGLGVLAVGNAVRIVSTYLVVLLLIDRLFTSTAHIRKVSAVQVQDARRQLHEVQNERAAWEARAVVYRRLLDKNHIPY